MVEVAAKLHVLLDSTPLGILTTPMPANTVHAIDLSARAMIAAGHRIYIPEVIDYELRRELMRANKSAGIAKLDDLKSRFRYLPIDTEAMLKAADLWAFSRNSGIPTGDPKKLDIDVIVCAQALTLDVPTADVIVATINVAHIRRFVAAAEWNDITP